MSIFGNAELFEGFENTTEDTRSSANDSDEEDSEKRYKKECEELRLENEVLKKSLRILCRPNNIRIKDSAREGPIAHVMLFNNLIARKYRKEVLDFFRELSNRKLDDAEDYAEVTRPQPTYIQYMPPSKQKSSRVASKRAQASLKAFQAFSSIQVYKKFFIDQIGEPLSFQDPARSEWFSPRYEQLSADPLSGDPENPQQKRKKPNRICFNCGEADHQVKDCPQSRDHHAINQRRQKFNEEIAKFSDGSPQIRLSGTRYHEEEGDEKENEMRFACYKPGIISSNLQEALGIDESNIPQYIYQMRRLGYPPGHLQNARTANSGLSLYNEQSKTNGRDLKDQYVPVDVSKIIGYPGFNMPPLPGQIDESSRLGLPPMDDRQSKESMISYFEHRNNLRKKDEAAEEKRKVDKAKETKGSDADIEEVDMEFGDDEPCDNEGLETDKTVEVEDMEDGELDDDGVEVSSLTEDELELKRAMLLKELEESHENKNDSDYRNVRTSDRDQDYRIGLQPIIDLTGTTSESDIEHGCGSIAVLEDIEGRRKEDIDGVVVMDTSSSSEREREGEIVSAAPDNHEKRTSSSDTDYRMNSNTLSMMSSCRDAVSLSKIGHHVESDGQSLKGKSVGDLVEKGTISEENTPSRSSVRDQRLPDREKFAEGITQFDAYYSESKSQGVYKKLRTLLKDSPRRQDKL